MKKGYLSEYFEGIAAKRLTAVETDETCSNQHEYNATKSMQAFLGRPEEKIRIPTRFLYLNDDNPEPIIEDAFLSYGNRRQGKPRSPEFRLYFPTTAVSRSAREGDLLFIAKKRDGDLLVIIAENGSSIGRQIEWLFGFADLERLSFSVKSELETEQDRIEFAARFILENIGIAVEASEDNYLDDMLRRFGNRFPTTREFSAYARSTLKDLSPKNQPDLVLMEWMEREEILFRTLEHHLIAERISAGFFEQSQGIITPSGFIFHPEKESVEIRKKANGIDVESFISFSLSVQNRRKSRVGLALENHLEMLFKESSLRYSRTAATENKAKPDFLFPGIAEYQNPSFDPLKLTMLGVKSTCKDRWRQVLAEADRINYKHLLTLETAISKNQTDEMAAKQLQLVIPRSLHRTYTPPQQEWLMDVEEFIGMARQRQDS